MAGRYRLLEQLGAGGMGSVHRAWDEAAGREVAFKQLSSSHAGAKRRTLEALFEREYHTLVRLKHPRIIEVYDYGLLESGPYYTMELLEGSDLQQLAPLPYKDACRHLRDVASSLALIHAHRLVHRDVSPRNVRLGREGRAKLIDFGALTAFGPANSVVGTPVCMAPEILRRMSLDQRTDLYALGAVAYWALTGHHAFPARRFEDLSALWQRTPVPPSKLVPAIPPELDALVMSLLALDPISRPPSAAAVIDQLTAIAGLPAEEHEHAAESYLSSGRMVGRKGEEDWVQKRVARTLQGKGGEVVIEGPAGVGKTRLLHELGLLAQLKGAVVLKADAEAAPGFFGVAAVLASGLLSACSDLAKRALAPQAGLLGELSAELEERLAADGDVAPPRIDANERRARLQTALYDGFLEVARERPLVIAVDNLQAADENSAAFLAALGSQSREARVLLLLVQRAGAKVVATAAWHALRKRCSRLKLANLSANACEELVGSLFGDVANTGRVAKLLYEKSAGNPQLCMDLAQILVKKKIARYAGGTWVLPLEVSAEELPSRVEEVLAAKLESLSPVARDLAESLAIHVKPIPIELCLAASRDKTEQSALAALDELVAEQVFWIDGTSYRFAQEALREALLAQMQQDRRREKHLLAAEALLAAPDASLEQRMEAGWHLLHGGDEGRGADLLASTSREFLKVQGATESVEHIVRSLRTAVEVYERLGRSDYQIAGLLFPMVPLAYFASDWRALQRYGVRAFQLGLKITGLGLAYKLRFFVGKKLALKLGMAFANRRLERQRKRLGIDYDLREAIASFCGMVPATMATFSTSLDAQGVSRLFKVLRPLSLFDASQFPSLMYGWGEVTMQMSHGQSYEARQLYQKLAQRFLDDPLVRKVLGEGHFKSMYGGVLLGYAVCYIYASMSRALELATEMEHLGVRTWAMSADQIRMLYHAYRGEIELARRYRAKVELYAVQGNATWQADLFLPAVLINSDVLTGDTIGARRSWEQLSRRAREVPSLQGYADIANAAYLQLRGALPAAIELYELALAEFPKRGRVLWLAVRGFYAQALNLAGEHLKAKALLVDALADAESHADVLALSLEARRQLALAESGLGNHQEAVRMLDALLAAHGDHDNPLLVGLLHKARAEVALAQKDKDAFTLHVDAMERRFRATRNPALIAQCERLVESAARAGLRPSAEPRGQRSEAAAILARLPEQRSAAELTAAADRAEYALWLIVEQCRAKSGHLYLFEGSGWRLAAASSPMEPPKGLETQLRVRCEQSNTAGPQTEDEAGTVIELPVSANMSGQLSSGLSTGNTTGQRSAQRPLEIEDDLATVIEEPINPSLPSASAQPADRPSEPIDKTVFIESQPAPAAPESVHRMLVLSTVRPGQRTIVGGVILEVGPYDQPRLDPALLETIGSALYERCVTSLTQSRSMS